MKLLSLLVLGAGVQAVFGALDADSQLARRAKHSNRAHNLHEQISSPRSGLARRASCERKNKSNNKLANNNTTPAPSVDGCFPSAGFKMPDASSISGNVPDNWWCNSANENGFLGFSYGLDGCPSLSKLKSDFNKMKSTVNARYVRLYSSCNSGNEKQVFSDVITAAFDAGIGVYALIWFGFDGDDSYKKRQSNLMSALNSNKFTPYVLRHIDVGSEPLFDHAIAPQALASLVKSVKGQVSKWGATVSISDMPYAYSQYSSSDVKAVLQAVDVVHANILPFFDKSATTGSAAWGMVSKSITQLRGYMKTAGVDKKIYFTQTGWPSDDSVWKANGPKAKAAKQDSSGYWNLLSQKCSDMKDVAGHSGVGWFWQIWSDDMLGGWGFLDYSGNVKITGKPVLDC